MTDPKFATFLARKRNEAELNGLIGQWTKALTPEEVMSRLQRAGVAAGVVANASDLYSDPQLRHRKHFWLLKHKELGDFSYVGQPARLSETPSSVARPSPCLGEHTEQVCREILGMSDDEFIELLTEGVFE